MNEKHAETPRQALPVLGPETWAEHAAFIHESIVKKWSPYSEEDRRFLALATAGEVGEILNLIKKDWRGDPGSQVRWFLLAGELADARIYLELLARCVGHRLPPLERGPLGDGVTARDIREAAFALFRDMGKLCGLESQMFGVGLTPSHEAVMDNLLWVGGSLCHLAALLDVDLDWACGVKVRELYERWPHTKAGQVFYAPHDYQASFEPTSWERLGNDIQMGALAVRENAETGVPVEPENLEAALSYVRYYMDAPAFAHPDSISKIAKPSIGGLRIMAHRARTLDDLRAFLKQAQSVGWYPL